MIQLIVYNMGPRVEQPLLWPWWLLIGTLAVGYVSTKLHVPERVRHHHQQAAAGQGTGMPIEQLVAAAYPNPFTAFMGTETISSANGLTMGEASPDLIRIVAQNQQWAEGMGYAPRGASYHGALRSTEEGL